MSNRYEEKRQARIERLKDRAEKAQNQATDAFRRAGAATEGIPFGQPILVGHHSEKRHRAAVAKSARAMDAGCEAMDDAPDGEVLSIDIEEVAARAVVGDMVLCRTNAPLVGLAHQLIRAGKRPDLRGRDLSRKIREMINRMDDKEGSGGQLDVPHLSKALQSHRDGETYRLTIRASAGGKMSEPVTLRSQDLSKLDAMMASGKEGA